MMFDQDLEGLVYNGQEMPKANEAGPELGPFGQMCADAIREGIEKALEREKKGYFGRLWDDIKLMIEDYKKW